MRRLVAFAALGCLAACAKEKTSRPDLNRAPVVASLSISGLPALPGDTLGIRAQATDPDDDALSYIFRSSAGSFVAIEADSALWSAPDSAGACTLTVEASDGKATTRADTVVTVLDDAPLTLAFESLLAGSNGDTMWAGAAPDTFPYHWTFHARWSVQSAEAVRQIRSWWRGSQSDLDGGVRDFEAPIDFSGSALLMLRAVGSQGEMGPPVQFSFVGNFDPHASFVRDAEGRRTFQAGGATWTEGDTLPHVIGGYQIGACVTASDRDGSVSGVQFRLYSGATWSQPSADTCLAVGEIDDGNYTFQARAIDDAQRIGPVDRLSFYVNLAPRFTVRDTVEGFTQRPMQGDTLTLAEARALDIRFWAIDPDGNVEDYRYRIDSLPWSFAVEPTPGPEPGLPAGCLSKTVSGLITTSGTHRISVLAADDGGRESQTNVTFTVIR